MISSEFGLIRKIKNSLSCKPKKLLRGIGEDCAVFEKDANQVTVVSSDALIEGVHFDLHYFSFFELGQKSMSVNLSDMAAMGATPLYALITLGLPNHIEEKHVLDLYAGMESVLQPCGAAIVGGDVTKSLHEILIGITIVGECPKNQCKMRNTAQVGDGIYVSGTFGTAALGLLELKKNQKTNCDSIFVKALKQPQAQVSLGMILAKNPHVHAMLDVSDGLVQDLTHILDESGVSAKIFKDEIPVVENFWQMCQQLKQNGEDIRLSGGEDYQLLFTMPDAAFMALDKNLRTEGFQVKKIGEIVSLDPKPEDRCKIFDKDGGLYQIKHTGYDHFG